MTADAFLGAALSAALFVGGWDLPAPVAAPGAAFAEAELRAAG